MIYIQLLAVQILMIVLKRVIEILRFYIFVFVFYLIFKVCLLITDHEFIDTKMNYQPYKAGKFAFSLRKRLMMEHLGLLEGTYPRVKAPSTIQINVEDPISNTFYEDIWCRIAESNTRIYEEVFKVFPTNLVCFLCLCNNWGVILKYFCCYFYIRTIVFTPLFLFVIFLLFFKLILGRNIR